MISWFLTLLILWTTAWSAFGVFRTTDGRATLLFNAGLTVVTVFLLAHAITLQWGAVVPIWLWWVNAVLLAIYLAGLTHRLLGGARISPSPTAAGTGR